jgi:hypothetical protein
MKINWRRGRDDYILEGDKQEDEDLLESEEEESERRREDLGGFLC